MSATPRVGWMPIYHRVGERAEPSCPEFYLCGAGWNRGGTSVVIHLCSDYSPTFAQREICALPAPDHRRAVARWRTGLVPRLHRIHPPESRLSPGTPSYSSDPLSLVAVRGLPSVSRTTGGSIGENQRRQW